MNILEHKDLVKNLHMRFFIDVFYKGYGNKFSKIYRADCSDEQSVVLHVIYGQVYEYRICNSLWTIRYCIARNKVIEIYNIDIHFLLERESNLVIQDSIGDTIKHIDKKLWESRYPDLNKEKIYWDSLLGDILL